MRHCTVDELLALKDGEAAVWTRTHLNACVECQREYEALNQRVAQLKALPAIPAPRDQWPAIRQRVLAERKRRRVILALGSLAAAASVALVLFAGGLLTPQSTYAEEILRAQQASSRLENALQTYDAESRVLNGAAAAAAAELEDRIALIDRELSEPALREVPEKDQTLMTLWRARVQLMDRLVEVHVTRAAYPGL
jgi:hypothetical protein